MDGLYQTQRIKDLKDKMLSEPRYASIEQALIITKIYQENEDDPRIIQRPLHNHTILPLQQSLQLLYWTYMD